MTLTDSMLTDSMHSQTFESEGSDESVVKLVSVEFHLSLHPRR
jgi:hypothetical protein